MSLSWFTLMDAKSFSCMSVVLMRVHWVAQKYRNVDVNGDVGFQDSGPPFLSRAHFEPAARVMVEQKRLDIMIARRCTKLPWEDTKKRLFEERQKSDDGRTVLSKLSTVGPFSPDIVPGTGQEAGQMPGQGSLASLYYTLRPFSRALSSRGCRPRICFLLFSFGLTCPLKRKASNV